MATFLTNQFLSRFIPASIRTRLFYFLPWLVLTFFLVVTYQLWKNAQSETEQALQTEFNSRVQDASRRVEGQMLAYEHMLGGLQGLFDASANVSRSEFHAFVSALNVNKNYPGVQGLGFISLIPKEKKGMHIASVRQEGYPEYTIRPDGLRDLYAPVLYIEPFSGRNLQAFGYDSYAEPLRRSVMERARDTGLSAISTKLKLAHEVDARVLAGFAVWLPVYRNGAAHNTVAERRANIIGWVGASFRMDDLMASIFDGDDNNLDIKIYDGKVITDQALMYDKDKIIRSAGSPESSFRSTQLQTARLLNISDQNWTMVLGSLAIFDQRLNNQKPRFIALSGITVSILMALIVMILVHSRSRTLQFAQDLNHELTERKRAEVGMRLAATVFDTVDTAVLVTDKHAHIINVNPAFTDITGYSADDVIGKNPRIFASGMHPVEFYKKMWATLLAMGSWQGEISNRKKNGEFFTEWLSINTVRDNDGDITHYVSLSSDITERKAEEERLHNLAHYDPLTGLPNRTLLTDRLHQAISSARREKHHMALMFMDLDKFKQVNDTLGHHIGDLLLKEVAKRILECLRESDSAARLGGDEFVVLLPFIEAGSDAVSVAEKIRHALNQPFELAGHTLNISSSIGVAVYPEHGSDEKSLLKNADQAMYDAKKMGRNNVMLFELKIEPGNRS